MRGIPDVLLEVVGIASCALTSFEMWRDIMERQLSKIRSFCRKDMHGQRVKQAESEKTVKQSLPEKTSKRAGIVYDHNGEDVRGRRKAFGYFLKKGWQNVDKK